jgi:hypothetical protein
VQSAWLKIDIKTGLSGKVHCHSQILNSPDYHFCGCFDHNAHPQHSKTRPIFWDITLCGVESVKTSGNYG